MKDPLVLPPEGPRRVVDYYLTASQLMEYTTMLNSNTHHRSPSNRGHSTRRLSDTERAELVQRHDMIDREEASKMFPGTKRFVCVSCRFATNEADAAKTHREWVRKKFEDDKVQQANSNQGAA